MSDHNSTQSTKRSHVRRAWLTLIAVGLGVFVMFAGYSSRALKVPDSLPAGSAQSAQGDYSKFSHRSSAHATIACAACHQRVDNSATPRFPGHKSCTGCHLSQFVKPEVPMCNICHSSLASGDPPLTAFPTKFKEGFNVKFDHAQHNTGEARPPNGCASCHSPSLRRGMAMSIPAGINTHNNCYQCHSPGKTFAGRDISSCATCHGLSSYRRSSTNSIAFSANFSHAKHGPRQRLNCADCHTLRSGLSQGQQVTSPQTAQHFPASRAQSCATCHNNKRAFGEKFFRDCARCHSRDSFRVTRGV